MNSLLGNEEARRNLWPERPLIELCKPFTFAELGETFWEGADPDLDGWSKLRRPVVGLQEQVVSTRDVEFRRSCALYRPGEFEFSQVVVSSPFLATGGRRSTPNGLWAVIATDADALDNPSAADADNALPDPARCAKLDGTSSNRNAEARTPTGPRTARSNRAARISASKNLRELSLGAGHRTPPDVLPLRRELPNHLPTTPPAESAADTADTARGDRSSPSPWPARYGSPDDAASAAPPPGRLHCNSGSADDAADKSVRTL